MVDTFTIEVGSQTFKVDTSTSGALFFGVTNSDAFTTLKITDLHDTTVDLFPTIDNFSFAVDLAPDTDVPEPASLLLLATGAVALVARRRQRKYA